MSDVYVDDLPQSIREQIENLDVGETYSRSQRFDPDAVAKNVPLMALRAMRHSLGGTVHTISERTGKRYRIETGDFRTQSHDIIVTAAVTRTG